MPNVAGERNGCVFPGQEKAIGFVLTFNDVGKAICGDPFFTDGLALQEKWQRPWCAKNSKQLHLLGQEI